MSNLTNSQAEVVRRAASNEDIITELLNIILDLDNQLDLALSCCKTLKEERDEIELKMNNLHKRNE